MKSVFMLVAMTLVAVQAVAEHGHLFSDGKVRLCDYGEACRDTSSRVEVRRVATQVSYHGDGSLERIGSRDMEAFRSAEISRRYDLEVGGVRASDHISRDEFFRLMEIAEMNFRHDQNDRQLTTKEWETVHRQLLREQQAKWKAEERAREQARRAERDRENAELARQRENRRAENDQAQRRQRWFDKLWGAAKYGLKESRR